MNISQITSVDDLLTDVEDAIRNGNGEYAYALCLQAVQAEPENMDAWALCASLAPSLEERMQCVNHMNELEPDHQDRHSVAFFALKELLDRDPFLAYREETQEIYRVINVDDVVLSIPKKRSVTIPYPGERMDKLAIAQRWLILAILGLLLAGIGTLIFAPLAAWTAVDAWQTSLSRPGQVGSIVVLVAASMIFIIGLFFSFLFALHVIG
jgi:hypothetical protein